MDMISILWRYWNLPTRQSSFFHRRSVRTVFAMWSGLSDVRVVPPSDICDLIGTLTRTSAPYSISVAAELLEF